MKARMESQVGKERIDLASSIPLSSPLVVYLELSRVCNLHCWFCPQSQVGKGVMSEETFVKVIKGLKDLPVRPNLLRVTGIGEPLMHPDATLLLRSLADSNCADRIELMTNGLMLGTKMGCLPYMSRVVCSVMGTSDEEYEEICGSRVDFHRLVSILRYSYLKKGECRFHIKLARSPSTPEPSVHRFLEFFGDYCDEISVENVVPCWPELEYGEGCLAPRYMNTQLSLHRVCPQVFKSLQIWSNGDVSPCCVDWEKVNLLGNVNRDSIIDMWRGDTIFFLQSKHRSGLKPSIPLCSSCSMNDFCEVDNIDSLIERGSHVQSRLASLL